MDGGAGRCPSRQVSRGDRRRWQETGPQIDVAPQPLAIEADHLRLSVGEGQPETTLKASRFEIMRAFSGRRSPAQIEAMSWTGDPTPFIPMFASGPFTFPPSDFVE